LKGKLTSRTNALKGHDLNNPRF